ncbi:MAG: hypothetical protein D6809_02465, partial [Gammaproteobacteria bacterium]
AQIDALLELSGLRQELRQAPEIVAREALQQGGPMPPERREALAQVLRQAYDPQLLEADVRTALGRLLAGPGGRRDLERALALLRSPLARRMDRLEEAAASPAAQEELERFAASPEARRASPARRALIRRLMKAQQAAEALLDLQEATFRGMVAAFNPGLPPERRLEGAELEQVTREMRRRARPQVERYLETAMLYTYREASDEELARYAELLERPAAQRVHRLLLRALEEAMGEAARRAGQGMRRLQGVKGSA